MQPLSGSSTDFSKLDQLVARAESKSTKVIYCFGSTPLWAALNKDETRGAYGQGFSSSPPVLQAYLDFVRVIATRYKGRIEKYELWNEVNNAWFFTGSYAQLFEMSKQAYAIIKSIDPAAIVLCASPCWSGSNTLIPEKTTADFFAKWFAMGGHAYCDQLAFHGYVYTNSPTYSDRWPDKILPHIAKTRTHMATYGVNKPLVDTESGWDANANIAEIDKPWYIAQWIKAGKDAGLLERVWYQWDNTVNGTLFASGSPTAAGRMWTQLWRGLPAAARPRVI